MQGSNGIELRRTIRLGVIVSLVFVVGVQEYRLRSLERTRNTRDEGIARDAAISRLDARVHELEEYREDVLVRILELEAGR